MTICNRLHIYTEVSYYKRYCILSLLLLSTDLVESKMANIREKNVGGLS